ncbi:MAG TPA: hypothetical protein VGR51_04400 [Thermoplasmata archaeon]|jgi:hypothetical protein|nr:hypothetical protein [Thermoplasmata archaeon]
MARATSRRHAYFEDGDRRVAEPIHPYWYTSRGIHELNEKLRAPPTSLRVRGIGREVPPAARAKVGPEALRLTREVMAALFHRTKALAERHLLDYPLPEIDPDRFASPIGRAASERYLRILRGHDPSFRPKPLSRFDFIPPIMILGTSRTGESLRMHALFTRKIAWNLLENQRSNAHADYCLDIAAIGSETALALLDYWWEGKDAASEHGIQEAYDTLFHEPLHRLCDLTNPFGPQYGPKGSAKEHYWMQEYEPFASQVERVIVAHLVAGKDRGLLRRRIVRG